MKRMILSFIISFVILPFFGCSVNTAITRECVSDTIENIPYPAMYIESDIPQGATLSLTKEDGRLAVFHHQDYEITQEIFLANSWDDAFIHISGKSTDELKPILAGNFPLEKYRCTWTSAGECGTDLWQSVIFHDGTYFYGISVQCPVEKASDYEKEFSDLLSKAELCGI